jgi:UDP-N-acetylglucosamine:LPS N-acetylglucosamine transferase
VVGHSRALEARLKRLVAGHEQRIKVFGFVDHVRPLMAAADILVTKAGGLTLAEALAAELPVICFGSLPGQEARNERFAAMAGVALVAGSGAQLQRVIAAALRDPGLLKSIRTASDSTVVPAPRRRSWSWSSATGSWPASAPRERGGGPPRRSRSVGRLRLGLARLDCRLRVARVA